MTELLPNCLSIITSNSLALRWAINFGCRSAGDVTADMDANNIESECLDSQGGLPVFQNFTIPNLHYYTIIALFTTIFM